MRERVTWPSSTKHSSRIATEEASTAFLANKLAVNLRAKLEVSDAKASAVLCTSATAALISDSVAASKTTTSAASAIEAVIADARRPVCTRSGAGATTRAIAIRQPAGSIVR
jgi:hypothetical protein